VSQSTNQGSSQNPEDREFNPAAFAWQGEAGQVLTATDRNLIVIAPTGAGKTDAAARAFEHCGRGVLVEPTRALCYEKKRELGDRLAALGIGVQLGNKDYGLSSRSFRRRPVPGGAGSGQSAGTTIGALVVQGDPSRVVSVVSPFKLGQLITNLGRKFADHCPVVVFDEVHQFGELEGLITLLKLLCPTVRIVALSATIDDEDKGALADWMGALVVESDIRPVPLVQRVVGFEPDFDGDRVATTMTIREVGGGTTTHHLREDINPREFNHVMAMYRHIVGDPDLRAPILVWTPFRTRAEMIAERLLAERQARPGARLDPSIEESIAHLPDGGSQSTELLKRCLPWGVGIHHGGLSSLEAERVYDLAAENRLVVLAGCHTVAQGLNLPWRHVIVEDSYDHDAAGERRLISPSFFNQVSGRAGRPGKDMIGYVWIPSFTEVDRVQIEEILLGTKASPLVSRMSDERALTVLVPQLVRLRFETVADLARFVQSTFWGTRLQDNIGLFDQLAHIVRYLVEESVLFTLGDLLVATERGAKLSALGLHPQEFSAIERLTTARSVDYEAWVDGLGRACLGTDPDDRDSEALSAVAEFGLSIYNEPGRGHSRARELADRVQRLMEITEAYFSHRLENVPREYQQAWVEAVLDRFTLGNLELARQLRRHLSPFQVKRLVRNLGSLMKGDQPFQPEHLAIVAASLYGDELVFRFGAGAEEVGRILGVARDQWLDIILAERGRR
jgi:replicative superfamily II helicase